ncbi:MAG: ATP-dependent Clp protease proteolytic subunit [Flavobacteriaceae bacterium]|nr:ATP-dependent Clp protease proteolytic subunit [Flavobacteriaceae bacterium]
MSKIIKPKDSIDATLLEQRKIFLWGMVDDDSALHCIERMLYLDSQSDDEITFIINSPGGYVTSGMAIYDTMQSLKSPVATFCSGLAASMGSILLSGGEKGKRKIQKYARVMIHQPSGGIRGRSVEIEIAAQEIIKTREIGAQILSENCGQTIEKVLKDFNRDYWMDSDESIKYGIVDEIV